MAIDSQGFVFVADCGNNRIELLDSTLTHFGYVYTAGHQLSQPHALHFDQGNGRLYIGEFSGRVVVLALRK